MKINNIPILEIIKFSLIMVIFGFIVSYVTDFLSNRPIIWLPKHSFDMASGTFFTSAVVFILFSQNYIKYKCSLL